jgi:hypothetical protein
MSPRSPEAELQGISIVALGSFNPAICQPLWFAGRNLISKEEAEGATIEIIHKDVSIFSLRWLSLQVTTDRFAIRTADPTKHRPLHDLMAGTFKILEHTPITAFGFNSEAHYKMNSVEEWHAFGDHYAPKDSWRGILSDPGLRSLIIEERQKSAEGSRRQIRVEPSLKIKPGPGIFIAINEHYAIEGEMEQTERIALLLRMLEKPWDEFLKYRDVVSQHLFTECTKEG